MAYLLSLCSCLSFLHVFWKRRLYPISDPVVCWFFKVFYYLMDIFFSCLCNRGGNELKTIWLPGEKGQNRYACVMNMILELSSPLILPQVIPWGWQLEREGQWGIFQIVQGFCRLALYSLDKAFPCFCSSPCHLQGLIICLLESTWSTLARGTAAFWLEPQTEP